MKEVLYEEQQHVEPWIFAPLVAIVTGSAGLVFSTHRDAPAYVAILLIVGMIAFLANLLTLRTRVGRNEISIQLGWIIPLYRKRILANQIRTGRPVTCGFREAGRGVHFGKLAGEAVLFFFMRGDRGLRIDTDTLPLIVSSETPETLWRAIEKARHSENKNRL